MEKLYRFNQQSLDFEPVSLRPLLMLPCAIILAFTFKLLYFNLPLIECTSWRGQKSRATISEYIKQQNTIERHDKVDIKKD